MNFEKFSTLLPVVSKALLSVIILLNLTQGDKTSYIMALTFLEVGMSLGGTYGLTRKQLPSTTKLKKISYIIFLGSLFILASQPFFNFHSLVIIGIIIGYLQNVYLKLGSIKILLSLMLWYIVLTMMILLNDFINFDLKWIVKYPFIVSLPILFLGLRSLGNDGTDDGVNVVFYATLYICIVEAIFHVILRSYAESSGAGKLVETFVLQNYTLAGVALIGSIFIRGHETNKKLIYQIFIVNNLTCVSIQVICSILFQVNITMGSIITCFIIVNLKMFILWSGIQILKDQNIRYMLLSSVSSIAGILLLMVVTDIHPFLCLCFTMSIAAFVNYFWVRSNNA